MSTIQHHGALIEETKISKIKVNQSTQQEVQAILGTPSSVPPFENQQVWYYISRTTENMMFFDPKLIDTTVYILIFSPQGVLQKMEKIDNNKVTDVLPVNRVTPAVGHETPVMKKLFRNLGKNPDGPSAKGSMGEKF